MSVRGQADPDQPSLRDPGDGRWRIEFRTEPTASENSTKSDWTLLEIENYLKSQAVSGEMVEFILGSIRRRLIEADKIFRRAEADQAAVEELKRHVEAERVVAERDRKEAHDQLGQAQFLLEEARARQATARSRRRPARAVNDVSGQTLRPDPSSAQTAAELMLALRRFRMWAGNPSFRSMAQRCEGRAGASTMCTALSREHLPERLGIIEAIIEGCGGSEEDRQRFATAWRRLAMKEG